MKLTCSEASCRHNAGIKPTPLVAFGLNDLLGATARQVKPSHGAAPKLLVRSPKIAVRAPRDNPPDLAEASARSLGVMAASRQPAEAEHHHT
jgi:hypothetical protein